jgi:hypothetical protein
MRALASSVLLTLCACGTPQNVDLCPDACAENTAQWCDVTHSPAAVNCSTYNATCAESSRLGAWCAVPQGAACTAPDDTRAHTFYCGDAQGPAAGLACDVDQGCVPSSAVCVADAPAPYCDLDTLVLECPRWRQPVIRHCKALGATACAAGRCVGVPAGGSCDATLGCAFGLTCSATTQKCEFEIAPHPLPPQVISHGGPVLASPRVMPISYGADPYGQLLDALAQQLTLTSYWSMTTSEYGVGALTRATPVHLSDPIPASLNDVAVRSLVIANTSGASPAWGAADTNTIYTLLVPESVSFISSSGACCGSFGGYHSEVHVGSTRVPYAIVCTCSQFDGRQNTDVDAITVTASHELVEAATDPYVMSAPAYRDADVDHAVWTILTEAELADMCELQSDKQFVPPGGTLPVQRTWSNKAALAGSDPCVPAPALSAGASLVLPDAVEVTGLQRYQTLGVKVALGRSATIDVPVFTNGVMEPFTVRAVDAIPKYSGGPPLLDLKLDREIANNGDVLKLTITPRIFNQNVKGDMFIVEAQYGDHVSWALGVVAPP